jgi:hypothetical protein
LAFGLEKGTAKCDTQYEGGPAFVRKDLTRTGRDQNHLRSLRLNDLRLSETNSKGVSEKNLLLDVNAVGPIQFPWSGFECKSLSFESETMHGP